jgi:hypothetical protein
MTMTSRLRPVTRPWASDDEVAQWLAGVSYKPGWTFDVEAGPKQTMLVVRAAMADSRGGDPLVVTHRLTLPGRSVVNDRRSFVGWLRHAIGKIEMHERDEWLLVDRARIFDPHAGIDIR